MHWRSELTSGNGLHLCDQGNLYSQANITKQLLHTNMTARSDHSMALLPYWVRAMPFKVSDMVLLIVSSFPKPVKVLTASQMRKPPLAQCVCHLAHHVIINMIQILLKLQDLTSCRGFWIHMGQPTPNTGKTRYLLVALSYLPGK